MSLRALLRLAVGTIGAIAFGAAALADGPAVSGINGKISGFGGAEGTSIEGDRGGGGFSGSVTLPIFSSLGLQIDGAYARIGSDDFEQTGAHLFWRDPDVGMLGFYGGYAHISAFGGQDIGRIGGEAQKFYGNFTLDGAAGWRFGDLTDKAYGRARVQLYPTDNLMLGAGYTYEGKSFGGLNAEYQVASSKGMGMSLFADGLVNDSSNYTVLGGIKFFFGDDMSLKDRHRRQDPDSYTTYDYQAAQQAAGRAASRQSSNSSSQSCPLPAAASPCDRWRQCVNAGYIKSGGLMKPPVFSDPASCNCQTATNRCDP